MILLKNIYDWIKKIKLKTIIVKPITLGMIVKIGRIKSIDFLL